MEDGSANADNGMLEGETETLALMMQTLLETLVERGALSNADVSGIAETVKERVSGFPDDGVEWRVAAFGRMVEAWPTVENRAKADNPPDGIGDAVAAVIEDISLRREVSSYDEPEERSRQDES